MRKLLYYIINPFKSKSISLIGMIRFSTDLLERFKAKNHEGQFDERIAATETALAQLDAAHTTDIGTLGNRKTRKSLKNEFRDSLAPVVETIYGKLVGEFGGQAAQLKQFFPFGRTIFHSSTDDELQNHLANLVEKVEAHEAELGTDLLNEVTALQDEWLALHDASEESTGQKADTEALRRDARARLADVLFENLLLISSMHKDQPELLGLYMQQHLLGGPSGTPTPSGDSTPLPPATGSNSGSTSSMSSSSSTSTSVSSQSSSNSSASTGSQSAGSTGSTSSSHTSMSQSTSSQGSSTSVGSSAGSTGSGSGSGSSGSA